MYGMLQPPCEKPPLVSSSSPPGAWATPSRLTNSLTITLRIAVSFRSILSTLDRNAYRSHRHRRTQHYPRAVFAALVDVEVRQEQPEDGRQGVVGLRNRRSEVRILSGARPLTGSQNGQQRMEPLWSPIGRNRSQPVANGRRPKTAQTSEKRCRALPPLAVAMVRSRSTVRVRQSAWPISRTSWLVSPLSASRRRPEGT